MAIIAVLLLVALFNIKYLICLFLILKFLITAITPFAILMLVYKLVCFRIAKENYLRLKIFIKKIGNNTIKRKKVT